MNLRRQQARSILDSLKCPRRDLLQVGSLGMLGLSLPDMLLANPTVAPAVRRAKSSILFFLEGGPAQHDMWDMKPDAPQEVRGEFKPIASTISGVDVCEHVPLLSQQMHHLCLIRSVHHKVNDHNAGAYYMLTGRSPIVGNKLITRDEPESFPTFGSVMAKMRPIRDLPEFVHLPDIMFNNGSELPGERAGFLGPRFNPMVVGDPSAADYRVPGLSMPPGNSMDRVNRRRSLLSMLDHRSGLSYDDPNFDGLDIHYRKAFSLLGSARVRKAFDLNQESPSTREQYGLRDRVKHSAPARKFGGLPHLGQCMLLARRLIESGVRLVTVCTGRRYDQTWDGHRQHFDLLRKSILPYFDQAFSALLSDLSERGLLDETLVVAMGEFGRTPKIGQITSSAGATNAGRDHWPDCYTVLLGGAGIQAGTVFGSSDREAAYPTSHPVTPEDVAATIYTALGIDPYTVIHDPLNRPHTLSLGQPITGVLT